MSLDIDISLDAGPALEVALSVGPGVLAIIGPNGAGKTTLLHAVAGLVALRAGRVSLGGKVLEDVAQPWRLPPEQRGAGVVFQDMRLFPHLTVLDNVAAGLRWTGAGAAAARTTAWGWLDRLGASHLAGARPVTLSGGEAQRVALARALAPCPPLLLLDEPLSAVDAAARPGLRAVLAQCLRDNGGVQLLVTHDPADVAALAPDAVAVLEAGRVVQQGSLAAVLRQPRTPWVAELAGVALLRATAADGRARIDGGPVVAAPTTLAGAVLVAVPPGAVVVAQPGSTPPGTQLDGATVGGVELHGGHWRVRLSAPLPLLAEVSEEQASSLRAGDAVACALRTDVLEVYPA